MPSKLAPSPLLPTGTPSAPSPRSTLNERVSCVCCMSYRRVRHGTVPPDAKQHGTPPNLSFAIVIATFWSRGVPCFRKCPDRFAPLKFQARPPIVEKFPLPRSFDTFRRRFVVHSDSFVTRCDSPLSQGASGSVCHDRDEVCGSFYAVHDLRRRFGHDWVRNSTRWRSRGRCVSFTDGGMQYADRKTFLCDCAREYGTRCKPTRCRRTLLDHPLECSLECSRRGPHTHVTPGHTSP